MNWRDHFDDPEMGFCLVSGDGDILAGPFALRSTAENTLRVARACGEADEDTTIDERPWEEI